MPDGRGRKHLWGTPEWRDELEEEIEREECEKSMAARRTVGIPDGAVPTREQQARLLKLPGVDREPPRPEDAPKAGVEPEPVMGNSTPEAMMAIAERIAAKRRRLAARWGVTETEVQTVQRLMDRTIGALVKIGIGESYCGEPLPAEKSRWIAREALGEVLRDWNAINELPGVKHGRGRGDP
jgi:hypothetical protein